MIKKIRNLSILTKLAGAFVIIIIITGINAYLSFENLDKQNNSELSLMYE